MIINAFISLYFYKESLHSMSENNEKRTPFINDWMFALVMRDPDICKGLLELVLSKDDIGEVKIATPDHPIFDENIEIDVTTQASLKFVEDMHGIRFDAYIKTQKCWAEIEMQIARSESLGKRARYYRCSMDYDCLEEGDDYEKLQTTYVIFLCTFDYEGKDKPIYFFRNWDVKNHLPLNDFEYTILLNSKCSPEKVPEGLRELYAYINDPDNIGETELVRNIDKRVRKFNNSKWRTRQMTYEYYLKEAEKRGIEQGEASGRAERELEMARAMKNEGIAMETIIKVSGLSKEKIEKL